MMPRFLFLFLFLSQCIICLGQEVEYLNSFGYPIVDLNAYPAEFIKVTTQKNGVIQSFTYNLDTVKVEHSTVLTDENGEKISERILGYYPNGEMKFNKRIDYAKDEFKETNYYEDGSLKSEIISSSMEILSETYYGVDGVVIDKPLIEDPEPKGGKKSWNNFLVANLQYPVEARSERAEGTVILAFDLDEEGAIVNPQVANPEQVHPALAAEALRILLIYPENWNPKKINGIPVPSEMKIPIRFKLS